MPSAAVAAASVLSKQRRPTLESIDSELKPFLAALKASPQLGTGLLSNLARRKKLRHVVLALKSMQKNLCEASAFHYGVSINACAASGDWKRALKLLRDMDGRSVEQNTVTFSAAISGMDRSDRSMDRSGQCSLWTQGISLLEEMSKRQLQKNVIAVSAGISACAKAEEWRHALNLMDHMCAEEIDPDSVAFNALISSLRSEWPKALHFLHAMSFAEVEADVISYSAALAALEEAKQWQQTLILFEEMKERSDRSEGSGERRERSGKDFFDDFSYNALISSFSRASKWQHALHVLGRKAASPFPVDIFSCSAAVSACERAGQWQYVLELWPSLQEVQEKANEDQKNFYELSADGPEHITRRLRRALEMQWAVGYPFLPTQEDQLTHGFFKYIAGMQALCARELLELVPDARYVMDMFCGSGTVLIEAVRAGKDATGCDVSPLALLVATHHTDARRIDISEFLDAAERLASSMPGGDWSVLKAQISEVPGRGIRDALHFILLVALSRARDVTYLHSSSKEEGVPDALPPELFLGLAQIYAARVSSLTRGTPGKCEIYRCDNRILRLPEAVDAIVTGPPYPGVYDYHSPASGCADLLGGEILYEFCRPGFSISGCKAPTCEISIASEASSSYALKKEIGQKGAWLTSEAFEALWQAEQEDWLLSAFENLKDEGTATLMIGDGDTNLAGDGGFDNLQPTLAAAKKAGFEAIATATIRSKGKHPKQPRGMKRTEHMVHLRKPRQQ